MGLIKEPKGIDLIIGPSVLTDKDKKAIHEVIAYYKKTGKIPVLKEGTKLRLNKPSRVIKKKIIA